MIYIGYVPNPESKGIRILQYNVVTCIKSLLNSGHSSRGVPPANDDSNWIRFRMDLCVEVVQELVDVRLPGKGNSNSHGARPVHQINDKVIRISKLSIQINKDFFVISADISTGFSVELSFEDHCVWETLSKEEGDT